MGLVPTTTTTAITTCRERGCYRGSVKGRAESACESSFLIQPLYAIGRLSAQALFRSFTVSARVVRGAIVEGRESDRIVLRGRTVDALFEVLRPVAATTGRSPAGLWDFVIGSSGNLVAGVFLIGNEALVKHDKCSYLPPFLVSMHHCTTSSEGG